MGGRSRGADVRRVRAAPPPCDPRRLPERRRVRRRRDDRNRRTHVRQRTPAPAATRMRGIRPPTAAMASARPSCSPGPTVDAGHVAGWVGVGGPGQGANGGDAWIQAGIASMPGMGTVLYAEITREGRGREFILVEKASRSAGATASPSSSCRRGRAGGGSGSTAGAVTEPSSHARLVRAAGRRSRRPRAGTAERPRATSSASASSDVTVSSAARLVAAVRLGTPLPRRLARSA